jgi:hypothetical protein
LLVRLLGKKEIVLSFDGVFALIFAASFRDKAEELRIFFF